VKYPTPVIGLAILATFALVGCTSKASGIAGTATPASTSRDTSASVPSSTATDPLATIDPCTLLDPAVISENKLLPDKSGIGPGTRYCRWDTGPSASGAGYNISINIYDQAGLDQLSTAGFAITNYPVGQHQGRMSKDTAGHDACLVSIGVTATSRVDVVGIDSLGGLDASCTEATLVAPLVEKKLPAGTN
jgi:hypothetical protein